MFARFNENPAMTLQDIKETKRYGRTHGHTDGRTDNVKTVYPLQTKFAGGIIIVYFMLLTAYLEMFVSWVYIVKLLVVWLLHVHACLICSMAVSVKSNLLIVWTKCFTQRIYRQIEH